MTEEDKRLYSMNHAISLVVSGLVESGKLVEMANTIYGYINFESK